MGFLSLCDCYYSAIRRRCVEKNWKKMFSLRHRRLEKEEGEQQQPEASQEDEERRKKEGEEEEATDIKGEPEKAEEPVKDEEAEKQATIAAAKTQLEVIFAVLFGVYMVEGGLLTMILLGLQELQEKLRQLTDQKHDKFLQLKEILVHEARSKSSGGATIPSKKRRVDDGGFSSPGPTSAPIFSSPESATPVSAPLQGAPQESSH